MVRVLDLPPCVCNPTGRLKRGDGGYAPHDGTAVDAAPIIPRGADCDSSHADPARPEKPDVLDWSIIKLWK
jgi:hypothetical protein